MEHEISILPFTEFILIVLLVGALLRWLKQPYIVAYIIVGICIGPFGLSLISDKTFLVQLGSIGVLFLLFFVGMELSIPSLVKSWKVAVIGTICQIIISVGCVWILGVLLEWSMARSIALGFVISLSSTAVVIKLLQERKILESELGSNVLGVLLVQDLCIVPMLIVVSLLGGNRVSTLVLLSQVLCGMSILAILLWVFIKQHIHLPISRFVKDDHEIEVFTALMLCFGLAVITELCHLSAALGAFTAGVLVSAAKETCWVKKSLEPFNVVFVGMFFISVGLLIDLNFFISNPLNILVLVFVIFLTNTFINAGIFRFLGVSWGDSIKAGSMLAQVGELGFLVVALGYRTGILTEYTYQITILIIAISLLLSPAWIGMINRIVLVR